MEIRVLDSLEAIAPADWNGLTDGASPFLRHEFLVALERNDCLEPFGWHPRHLVALEQGRLVGAVPAYLKSNSYGEFVFDWAWASAYERQGIPYYPKLVVAVPYTPATGPRLLVPARPGTEPVADALVEAAIGYCRDHDIGSLHWLFPQAQDQGRLLDHGLLERVDCQYHWHNRGWGDFDAFLADLTSAKRKKLRRERRYVAEAGIEVRLRRGSQMDDDELALAHRFYAGIYARKYGVPTLSAGFFREIGRSLGDTLLVVFAYHRGTPVAASVSFQGADTLYGRFWGCDQRFHSLHFELCYYVGIEHCIREGLARFEPGAQGEHKIARGFLPTATRSAHWIAHTGFRAGIARHLEQERPAIEAHCAELAGHSPYRSGGQ